MSKFLTLLIAFTVGFACTGWVSAQPAEKWSVMRQGSDYFALSSAPFMINYRVAHLESLVDKLESGEFGKFIHILDGDGNKVEFWEPPA